MLTVTHKALDIGGFEAWVKTAKPGQVCLYHTGMLANDRVENNLASLRVHSLASVATDSAKKGLVNLVQRRLGAENYEYLAVRTAKPFGNKAPSPQPEALAA
jgi:hypothetical protein